MVVNKGVSNGHVFTDRVYRHSFGGNRGFDPGRGHHWGGAYSGNNRDYGFYGRVHGPQPGFGHRPVGPQATLSRGQVPLAEVFDGVCLFASGLLLITPGFVTDAVGGVLLVPWFRLWLRGVLVRRLLDTGSGPDDGGGDWKNRVIDG
jgi:hypothetical protein